MTRVATRTIHLVLDGLVLVTAYALAYALRFDWNVPDWEIRRVAITLPYLLALQYGLIVAHGVHRFAWRYVGLREVTQIVIALSSSTALLLGVRMIAQLMLHKLRAAEHAMIPIGVILIDGILAICLVSGIRMVRRATSERAGKLLRRDLGVQGVPTILIGAGQAGMVVAREIEARPDLGIVSVGFVDDDVAKIGTVIHGIRVWGTTDELVDVCGRTGAKQVLITIARAAGKDVRRIVKLCEQLGIPVKIIPSIHEIVGGKVNLSHVRNVAIDDLLGRDPVRLDETAISEAVHGRVILVTGAGGSIGSELCRQVCRFAPRRLLLVERAEHALFEIHRELIADFPQVSVLPCIGDVSDAKRMHAIFSEEKPSLVFHAAAHKHVPMMEANPGEAIKNNVLGTRTLADMAHIHGAAGFVMISTDKAVNPTSIMGASKRVAEIYIQALSQKSETRFLAVRFGNVLGSAGSVVPIFQEQIARGGPVTVTHPEMRRYFMTIPEASQLVLQAATMGRGGEIFILDMGEPVRIVDLAHDLIRLTGLKPNDDIEIRFTGIRPGEKLFEELSVAEERAEKTRHQKIFVGRLKPLPFAEVTRQLEALSLAAEDGDLATVREHLARIVPELQAPASADTEVASSPSAAPPALVAASR